MPRLLPILIALSALAFCIEVAPAQQRGAVQRCTTPDGNTLYTDKACADLGAVSRLPQASVSGAGGSLYRGGCSRTLSDLVYQITGAIDAKDVNRLAGVYEWRGASNASAHRTLDRLEAIVKRPLVDIVAVRPAPPPILDDEGRIVDDNSDGYYPSTSVRQRPVGLRLEQTLANGTTPSRTVFGLRRYYDCFWITL